MPRGGRRPGAGAPRGNTNALRHGQYSRRVAAMNLALRAVPMTADYLLAVTKRDRRRLQTLAQALHYYADLLLLIADGTAMKDINHSTFLRAVINQQIHPSANSGRSVLRDFQSDNQNAPAREPPPSTPDR